MTRSPNVPGGQLDVRALPRSGEQHAEASAALNEGLSWVLGVNKADPASFEKFWLRHPHSAQKGIQPLERFSR